MPAAADGMAHRPEEDEDEADDQHDDADRPEDGDFGDEADDEQDKTENDLLLISGRWSAAMRYNFVMAIRARRATFEERVSACEALESGASADTVAQVMGVSRSSVFSWWNTYRLQVRKRWRQSPPQAQSRD